MFSHVMLGADDVLAAKTFYDAILGTIGIAEGVIDEWGRVVYSTDAGRFLITKPINRLPATFANGGTIGFLAKTSDEVDAWHAAGLATGGSAIEDLPGERQATGGRVLYLAYLRDPAGNKVCATHRIS
ncbi:VOC family protein [Croceibacterium ferulae]|uniref:VOC family protein n=1 Tax=Croceibacterium ferulae TaxID=1854641 RepID=UPI000EAE1245|nr:VOC family protein [Croceibacterium ferulae]